MQGPDSILGAKKYGMTQTDVETAEVAPKIEVEKSGSDASAEVPTLKIAGGLIWSDVSTGRMSLEEAEAFCELKGKNWRLPTEADYRKILEELKLKHAEGDARRVFFDQSELTFWTATRADLSMNRKYFKIFFSSRPSFPCRSIDDLHHVRCCYSP